MSDDITTVTPIETEVLTGKVFDQLTEQEKQHRSHVLAVASQIGYELPGGGIDPDLIQRDVAANMRRSVEAVLEVGRALTVLKECCGHGEFLPRLEVLGLDRTVATRFMSAAKRFSNVASTHHLKQIGTQGKLLELLVLNDEQTDQLLLEGQTSDLTLDDVERMTTKELRAKIREIRQEGNAKDRIADNLRKQLQEANNKAAIVAAQTPDERKEVLLRDLRETMLVINNYLELKAKGIIQALQDIDPSAQAPWRELVAGEFYAVRTNLAGIASDFYLPMGDLIESVVKHQEAQDEFGDEGTQV